MPENSGEIPIFFFPSAKRWEEWLSKNHGRPQGVWLRFFKKSSGIATMTYDQALEAALCYGWIDGQAKRYDDDSYLQRFTPRQQHSGWSKRNTAIAERLIKERRMRPPGQRAIEAAKADGRWERAYDSPANARPPSDFLKALGRHPKAKAFFARLEKRNSYAIIYRLQTARTEDVRKKRMKEIIAMLEKGKKFHH